MKISYSKLSTFASCPQRYKFKYVDNIPDLQTDEMKIGSLLHEAIHKLLKNLPIDSIENEFIIHRAKKVVEDITKKYSVIGSEVYFSLPYLGTEFEGYIDLVTKDPNGNLYVLDFKVGNGSFMQTVLYALMLEKAKGKKVHFVGLIKIPLSSDETITESIRPLSDEYRNEAEQYVLSILEKIRLEQFSPKPGEHCFRCSYVEFCPLRDFLLEKKLDKLTLEQKLDLLQYIDAFKDSLQKQLKDVLQTTDKIESESAIAFLEETTYKRLTVKKLPDEVYTTLFDVYGFDAFEPKKELVEEHFPSLFKTINQKRLKITVKEG